MDKSRIPVIIGAAQYTQPKDIPAPLDPLGLMIKTAESALSDAADINKIRDLIDSVYVISIWGWTYKDAPASLSSALGLNPAHKLYSNVGGNIPQYLVNKAARAIALGESKAVLISGGESEYSMRRAKRQGLDLNWPEKETPDYFEGKKIFYMNDIEQHYGLVLPIEAYAILETALRRASGWSHTEHFSHMGSLLERYSGVAVKNPYAWSKNFFSAEEITSVTADNRYLNYPFIKRFAANIGVDQSASVIITSEDIADRLEIAPGRRVYPTGGADIENIAFISRHHQ